jgi:hypothetical protein
VGGAECLGGGDEGAAIPHENTRSLAKNPAASKANSAGNSTFHAMIECGLDSSSGTVYSKPIPDVRHPTNPLR